MKENWANSLKQRMAGYQQPVDDALWADIARASGTAGIRWWPWVASALASAAAVITIVLLLQPEPVIEPVIVSSGEMVAAVEEEPITEPVRPSQTIPVHPGIERAEARPQENGIENEKTAEGIITIPDAITPIEHVAKDESTNADGLAEDEWAKIIAEEAAPQRSRVKVTTSFYAQASPFGNRHSAASPQVQQDDPELPQGDTPAADPPGGNGTVDPDGESEPDDPDDETKALGRSVQNAQTQPNSASADWTHAFPLQIGARVSFSWNEHWSMDTGLTFLHFNSWNADTQQRMEFLGIPLYVNYMIGSARNFSFYASAGGQAFKCFAGNAPDRPWLFSCGLGAGAEYHVSPLVSFFVEPGTDWYFHTGESNHYYTDNPFAFSLSLGFRLHLL